MKFICLIYMEPGRLDRLEPAEREALDRASQAYDEKLAGEGRLVAASALQGVATARTLRMRGGRRVVLDGPFAETKEVLVGFILFEAAGMDEAVRIAKGVPMAAHAAIEVRPEFDF